jgi:hypothetical protein
MLDEIILDIEDRRYVGHVYADPGPPLSSTWHSLHWHFSSRGQFVAEFPALPTDTPDAVRCRLCAALERVAARLRSSRAPIPEAVRLTPASRGPDSVRDV